MSPRRLILSAFAVLLLAGCSEKLPDGLRRSDSREFTADEAKAVAAAEAELEKSSKNRIDARYSVVRVPEGYRVHVSYVTKYQDGLPLFIPGGFSEVLVSTQWTVIKTVPGA